MTETTLSDSEIVDKILQIAQTIALRFVKVETSLKEITKRLRKVENFVGSPTVLEESSPIYEPPSKQLIKQDLAKKVVTEAIQHANPTT